MSSKKKIVWSLDLELVIEAMELAQANGKKKGDSFEDELMEVIKARFDKGDYKSAKVLGSTDLDSDMLTGELRDRGMKVFNMSEELRRREHGQL